MKPFTFFTFFTFTLRGKDCVLSGRINGLAYRSKGLSGPFQANSVWFDRVFLLWNHISLFHTYHWRATTSRRHTWFWQRKGNGSILSSFYCRQITSFQPCVFQLSLTVWNVRHFDLATTPATALEPRSFFFLIFWVCRIKFPTIPLIIRHFFGESLSIFFFVVGILNRQSNGMDLLPASSKSNPSFCFHDLAV